jgi:hypothetical protein
MLLMNGSEEEILSLEGWKKKGRGKEKTFCRV